MNETQSTESFLDKVMLDLSSTMTIFMSCIGDKLGLFKDLSKNGSSSAQEIASRLLLSERYVIEWLKAMASAEYISYNSQTNKYNLPENHVPVLAQELGPEFVGGWFQQFLGLSSILQKVIDPFANGGGVPYSEYQQDWWHGMERKTGKWFENLLVNKWLEKIPELKRKLEQGIHVADVGTGHGLALIKLAQAFPKSTFVGYDINAPSIAEARRRAKKNNLDITFEVADIASGIPEKFDLITAFDVIHDLAHPLEVLSAIRNGLKPDGSFLLLDYESSDVIDQNFNPKGALMYGISIMYCLTTSLSSGGIGLGTLGMSPSKVKELSMQAGFNDVTRIKLDDPLNALFEIKI